MALSTVGDLITRSYQLLLGMNPGESPSTAQLSQGLDILNSLLSSLGARDLLKVAPTRESFTLTANKSSYTIGASGSDLTSALYIQNIISGFIRDSDNYDTKLDVITREIYDSYYDKSVTTNVGVPTNIFYDPGLSQESVQKGTIYLYPIPDENYTLFLTSQKGLTQYSATTDSLNLPLEYNRMLIYNLCVELSPSVGRRIPAEIATIAIESMRIIENMNAKNQKVTQKIYLPDEKPSYNIFTE